MISTAVTPRVAGAMVQGLTRASELREKYLEIYQAAYAIVEERKQWPSGHSETVRQGKIRERPAKIWLKNVEGRLLLEMSRDGRNLVERLIIQGDYWNPFGGLTAEGWKVFWDEADFLRWHTDCRRQIHEMRI